MILEEAQALQDQAHQQVIRTCQKLKRQIQSNDELLREMQSELEEIGRAHANEMRKMSEEMEDKIMGHKQLSRKAAEDMSTKRRENEGLMVHLRRLAELQRDLSVPILSAGVVGVSEGGERPVVFTTVEIKVEEAGQREEVARRLEVEVLNNLERVINLDSDLDDEPGPDQEAVIAPPTGNKGEDVMCDRNLSKRRRRVFKKIVGEDHPHCKTLAPVEKSVGCSPVKSSVDSGRSQGEEDSDVEKGVEVLPDPPERGLVGSEGAEVGRGPGEEEEQGPGSLGGATVVAVDGCHGKKEVGAELQGNDLRSDEQEQAPLSPVPSSSDDNKAEPGVLQASEADGEKVKRLCGAGLPRLDILALGSPEDDPVRNRTKEKDGTWEETVEDGVKTYICKLSGTGTDNSCDRRFSELRSLNAHRKDFHQWRAWQILGKRGRPPKPLACAERSILDDTCNDSLRLQQQQAKKPSNSQKKRKAQIQAYSQKRKLLRENSPEVRQRGNYASSKARFLTTMSSRIERELRETEYPEKLAVDPAHLKIPSYVAVVEPWDFNLEGWHDAAGLSSEGFRQIFSGFSSEFMLRLKERLRRATAAKQESKVKLKESSEAKAVLKGRVRNPLVSSGNANDEPVASATDSVADKELTTLPNMILAFGKTGFKLDRYSETRKHVKELIQNYVKAFPTRTRELQSVQHQFRVRRARELFSDWELRYWRFQPPTQSESDALPGPVECAAAGSAALVQAGQLPEAGRELVKLVQVKSPTKSAMDRNAASEKEDDRWLAFGHALEGRRFDILSKETERWCEADVIHYSPCDCKHVVVFVDGRIQCISLAAADKIPPTSPTSPPVST